MPPNNCCRSFLAFHLKLLNFLQTFIGVSIIIYSAWMLNRWNQQTHNHPPSAPSPKSSGLLLLNSQNADVIRAQFHHNLPLNLAAGIVSGLDDDIQFGLNKLPAPWFIYTIMGVGILLCSVTCIGHIAAEAINGCCLCFYSLLNTILLVLEASMVAFLVLDKRWEKDLPSDSTGELESLRSFIEDNIDVCKWVGVAVVIIQALSLLLSLLLRALVSTRREDDYESDDDYAVIRGRTWEPLLNPQVSRNSGSTSTDSKGTHSDIWSNRIREKYGLHGGDVKFNLVDTNPTVSTRSSEDRSKCSIL
ncbi:Tetraspanin/Peripherin [Macleaya cordata]|uniref:Tetraspanin/Peripherin n=1 Tax=Macleaya cordata TaxID=56857 RepID=A0A200PVL6_MACCD|nr:Tetraspanin/Peripherin [Macleaya cordata]